MHPFGFDLRGRPFSYDVDAAYRFVDHGKSECSRVSYAPLEVYFPPCDQDSLLPKLNNDVVVEETPEDSFRTLCTEAVEEVRKKVIKRKTKSFWERNADLLPKEIKPIPVVRSEASDLAQLETVDSEVVSALGNGILQDFESVKLILALPIDERGEQFASLYSHTRKVVDVMRAVEEFASGRRTKKKMKGKPKKKFRNRGGVNNGLVKASNLQHRFRPFVFPSDEFVLMEWNDPTMTRFQAAAAAFATYTWNPNNVTKPDPGAVGSFINYNTLSTRYQAYEVVKAKLTVKLTNLDSTVPKRVLAGAFLTAPPLANVAQICGSMSNTQPGCRFPEPVELSIPGGQDRNKIVLFANPVKMVGDIPQYTIDFGSINGAGAPANLISFVVAVLSPTGTVMANGCFVSVKLKAWVRWFDLIPVDN